MSLKAILFDLDDTLLGNNNDRFLTGYFPLLSDYVKDYIAPGKFIEELMIGTQAMIQNMERDRTNSDIFWDVFCSNTGLERRQFEPYVVQFYKDEFYKLEGLTHRKSEAKKIIEYCFTRQQKVAIATNPLFPMSAISQRLEWADIPADKYDFAIITAYENMHSAKPQAAYYEEILEKINVSPQEAMMVGDNWENDMVPAASLGLQTYWITDLIQVDSERKALLSGYGALETLHYKLSVDWLHN